MLLLALACTAPDAAVPTDETGHDDTAKDTGDTADTATTTPVDADADGFPDWRTTTDPSLADCDDSDATVTPATEVYIPAGPFTRGQEGVPDAEPVRTLTLSDFCADVTEVTNTAFVALLTAREADGVSNADDDGAPLFDVDDADDVIPERISVTDGVWSVSPGYEAHPVVEVWERSAAYYCDWRGKALPTEAQWEKAARGAEDTRSYPWGDDPPDCARANIAVQEGDSGVESMVACVGDSTPVHTYPAGDTPSGIADLSGNVSEWVSDWFDPEGYATAADTDPTGPAEGVLYDDGMGQYIARVDRGGNFLTGEPWNGVSARFPEPEDATSNGVGFRCVRPLVR